MTELPTPPGCPHDSGLFGPGSVTWRIASEPVMWIAGLRAMYLQALHPRVMLGTWQNTALARPDEAWGRFTRTVAFVRVRTFGTTAEVDRAGARLRKIHATLRGIDADGREFRLDEPELLLWVHCCEIGSYVEIARRSGMHVTLDELDSFIDEQRRSAAVVGLDPAIVPASLAGLDAYFDRMRPGLRVTPEARHAMRASFTPKMPPAFLPLRLMVPPLNALGYASLPPWARRLYGTPGLGLTEPAVTLALRTAFETTTRLPPQLLLVPAGALSRRIRAAGAAGHANGVTEAFSQLRRVLRDDLDQGQRAALASWLSFAATFAAVRGITYSIRAGRGPFHNVSAGGEHLHHYLWGIGMLAGVGAIAVHGEERHRSHPAVAMSYGSGLALIVDEFALLLDLQDVYWARQGRISVDVGIGGIAATGSYFALLPVARAMGRRRREERARPVDQHPDGRRPAAQEAGASRRWRTSSLSAPAPHGAAEAAGR